MKKYLLALPSTWEAEEGTFLSSHNSIVENYNKHLKQRTSNLKIQTDGEVRNTNHESTTSAVAGSSKQRYPNNVDNTLEIKEGDDHSSVHADKALTDEVSNNEPQTQSDSDSHSVQHSRESSCNKCEICGKTYKSKQTLKVHLLFHREEKPFKCDKCSQSFKTSSSLSRHKRIHSDLTPYKCSHCDRSFKQKRHCQDHERTHDDSLKFYCNICPHRSFVTASLLKRHQRFEHSSEGYPYKCTICGRGFMLDRFLKDHMNTHTGEKPYGCKSCDKSFSYREGLLNHEKLHLLDHKQAFQCSICGAGFPKRAVFQKHMERHQQPRKGKVFRCKVCQMEFSNIKDLKIHRISHI